VATNRLSRQIDSTSTQTELEAGCVWAIEEEEAGEKHGPEGGLGLAGDQRRKREAGNVNMD